MKISVLVCTRDRADTLVGCLESIKVAIFNIAPTPAEIVVVDNGSTDHTVTVVAAFAAECSFPVHYVLEPKAGVSRAKNTGIRAAKGDLLVLTDDDCRLDPAHLQDALRHDSGDAAPVLRGGRVNLGDPTDLAITIKTEEVAKRWHRSMNVTRVENLGNAVVGCNLAVRRELIEAVGGFDESLGPGCRIPAAEDTDFVFKTYLQGFEIEYVPDMAVSHFHGRKSPSEGFGLFRNYMIGNGAMYAKYLFKHPNFAKQFYWDAKASVRDLFRKRSYIVPAANFYNFDKVRFCVSGFFLYLGQKVSGKTHA